MYFLKVIFSKFFQERIRDHVKDFRELEWKVYYWKYLCSTMRLPISIYSNVFCYRWIVLCRRRITPETQTDCVQHILKIKTAILEI